MRTGLTKQEKTTDIWFDEKDPLIHIRTHNTDLKKRLLAYSRKYPAVCKLTGYDPETGCKEFEIEKGRVDIVIGAEGDEPIYVGNDVDSGKFELPVSAAGQYKVTVEARGAAGEIAVQRLPNAAEE